MSLKLVAINIEGQKHLKEVREFLEVERADVVVMAGVFEDNLSAVTEGYEYVEFVPGYLADQDKNGVIVGERRWGEVFMSHYPLENVQKIYLGEYAATHLPKHREDTHTPVLMVSDVATPNNTYRVGTVHGTWTKGGTRHRAAKNGNGEDNPNFAGARNSSGRRF
jgi:hypothetical protein